ncbi:MAG: helix-turn-helix transcriptional regulator [Acidobacteriaceae bacterium]
MDRIIRMAEILKITGVSRQTIYTWEKQGKFPKRATALPAGTPGWLESEISVWLRGTKGEGL